MSGPEELSFDEILKFMVQHDGKVTNHELVKHFKKFLTDPATRDEARNTFKKHVNSLASIKNQNNEKWLILKRKYMVTNKEELMDVTSDNKSQDLSNINSSVTSVVSVGIKPEDESFHELPPYRPPPEFSPKVVSSETNVSNIISPAVDAHKPTKLIHDQPKENEYPQTFMVRELKSEPLLQKSDQSVYEKREKFPDTRKGPRHSLSVQDNLQNIKENVQLRSESSTTLSESEQKISVEERKRMFNRMASEGDTVKPNPLGHRKSTHGVDEEDRASGVPLDPKGHEWIVRASAGDYHALAKMCSENPKFVKLKDPATGYTAMHWACKRGDENLVKMLAGLARSIVNERSNGGYTPLHIAMQFRHEGVYKLLIEVYDADPNVRDWSGRKPRQYLVNTDTALSPDAYRKFKVKADKKNAEKDLGFLRIGSLNVRVKKTTEAFSNFLGVGNARTASYGTQKHSAARNSTPAVSLRRPVPELDSLHKSWGSADNIQNEDKGMPPPQYGKVKRKNVGNRRGGDTHSRSTPSTPSQPRAHGALAGAGGPDRSDDKLDARDSDSDSAAGFHSAWQSKRSSLYNT